MTGELAVVTARGLRLREAAALTSRVLRTLSRGTRVRVMERSTDGLWTRVEQPVTGGTAQGWMSSKYLGGVAHVAASAGLREEAWMFAAIHELGQRELPGDGNSLRVLAYLASTDLDRALASTDETPWCSAFVNWCFEVTGYVGTNSAAARSWLGWGQSLLSPRRGAVTVLSREGGGHVGFFVSQTATEVRLLGGNQDNRVCMADYDRKRVLGHRVPS